MISPRSWPGRVGRRLTAFFSAPQSAQPLGVFRIGVSLVLLVQAWTLAGHLQMLFGERGLAPWSLTERIVTNHWGPRMATLVQALGGWGLSSKAGIELIASLYAVALVGLLVGWRTRVCAVMAWGLHTLMLSSSGLFVYGLETFAHISLFYCVVMPVGAAFSLDRRFGRVSGEPSQAAALSLRVLQLHLCVMYFATGFDKLHGAAWREGTAIWQILMQPHFSSMDFSWIAYHPWVSRLVSWGTLVVELGYVLFIWPRRTRGPWVLATVGMHLGIAVIMGLWLFGSIMAVLTFSAFGWNLLAPVLARRIPSLRDTLSPGPVAPPAEV